MYLCVSRMKFYPDNIIVIFHLYFALLTQQADKKKVAVVLTKTK